MSYETKNSTNLSDLARHETSPPSQITFQEACVRMLEAKNFVGSMFVNCTFAMKNSAYGDRSKPHGNHKYVLRAPDIAFIRAGLVIEIDGSSHDDYDPRVARDTSREHDWDGLGFDCLRIPSNDVYNPARLTKILSDVLELIRNAESAADSLTAYHRRRKRIQRAARAYEKQCPGYEIQASTTRTSPHSPKAKRKLIPRRRGGVLHFSRKS